MLGSTPVQTVSQLRREADVCVKKTSESNREFSDKKTGKEAGGSSGTPEDHSRPSRRVRPEETAGKKIMGESIGGEGIQSVILRGHDEEAHQKDHGVHGTRSSPARRKKGNGLSERIDV